MVLEVDLDPRLAQSGVTRYRICSHRVLLIHRKSSSVPYLDSPYLAACLVYIALILQHHKVLMFVKDFHEIFSIQFIHSRFVPNKIHQCNVQKPKNCSCATSPFIPEKDETQHPINQSKLGGTRQNGAHARIVNSISIPP